MALRENTPGLPNMYSGQRARDPLPITKFNVDEYLVGWMTAPVLAAALGITTSQGVAVLVEFLDGHNYAKCNDGLVVVYSKFGGVVRDSEELR